MVIVVLIIVFIGLGYYVYPYLKKSKRDYSEEEIIMKGNLLKFTLKNRSNEILDLDLCNLNPEDIKYSFNTSTDYNKLMDYLKTHILYVHSTIVSYNHENWHSDIIYSHHYSPFSSSRKTILIGIDSFVINSLTKKIIQSNYKYVFNTFNTLTTKLSPKEEKEITLIIVENQDSYKHEPIKCALKIKNNSLVPQNVRLFDDKYYLSNKSIGFESVFENTYREVLAYYDINELLVKNIKIYSPKITRIRYSLNNEDALIDNSIQEDIDEKWKSYFSIDLLKETLIEHFELIELQPNQEIIISFK